MNSHYLYDFRQLLPLLLLLLHFLHHPRHLIETHNANSFLTAKYDRLLFLFIVIYFHDFSCFLFSLIYQPAIARHIYRAKVKRQHLKITKQQQERERYIENHTLNRVNTQRVIIDKSSYSTVIIHARDVIVCQRTI